MSPFSKAAAPPTWDSVIALWTAGAVGSSPTSGFPILISTPLATKYGCRSVAASGVKGFAFLRKLCALCPPSDLGHTAQGMAASKKPVSPNQLPGIYLTVFRATTSALLRYFLAHSGRKHQGKDQCLFPSPTAS
jgi:hypothetical protein